jgi:serine/threonine protein kinase
MAIETVEAFVAILRDHRLLQPDQLDELNSLLSRFSEPRSLAKYLVQRSWLTIYQVNLIFQGQGAELVQGPYRILDRLGSGGVSQVFKAWHTKRNCVVALKVIRPEMLSNAEAVARFQREMRALTQASHPNIVRAFDINLVNNIHYFAMEYVEGNALDKQVHLSGPLPISRACDYIRQAALALQHAHERGLVHRDIKPANLLVNAAGTVVKILDLGLARLSQSSGKPQIGRELTADGVLIGTPDYLAPEQAKNPRTVDIRADIYSLGCTLYFLLTGKPPFPEGTLMQKLYKHQTEPPPSGEHLRPGLPPALVAIFQKMMAKKADDRYQTPVEVAQALEPFCQPDPPLTQA